MVIGCSEDILPVEWLVITTTEYGRLILGCESKHNYPSIFEHVSHLGQVTIIDLLWLELNRHWRYLAVLASERVLGVGGGGADDDDDDKNDDE